MTTKNNGSRDPAKDKAPARATETNDSVDQIRDIIFGQQMREYEARFRELEARLIENHSALQSALEARMEHAIAALDEEKASRETAFSELTRKLADASDELRAEQDLLKTSLNEQFGQVQEQFEQQHNASGEEQAARSRHIAELIRRLADDLERNDQDN